MPEMLESNSITMSMRRVVERVMAPNENWKKGTIEIEREGGGELILTIQSM